MDLQHGLRFVEETSIRASTGKLKSEKGKSSKIQNCRIHSTDKSGVVCGRAVLLCHTHIKTPPTPDLEFGIQASPVALFPQRRAPIPLCFSSPRCIPATYC